MFKEHEQKVNAMLKSMVLWGLLRMRCQSSTLQNTILRLTILWKIGQEVSRNESESNENPHNEPSQGIQKSEIQKGEESKVKQVVANTDFIRTVNRNEM